MSNPTLEVLRENIVSQELAIKNMTSPAEIIGSIFNIISLKKTFNDDTNLYMLNKLFFENYIKVVVLSDYGYDKFNFEKIEFIINSLPVEQQLSIMEYILSKVVKEIPEHDRKWFLIKKKDIEIKLIWRRYSLLGIPNIIFIYISKTINSLIISFIAVFTFTFIILLPVNNTKYALYEIHYEKYSSSIFFNHFLNVMSLFADIDNDLRIKPLNEVGVIFMIISKFIFVLLVANFIYTKVIEKLTN